MHISYRLPRVATVFTALIATLALGAFATASASASQWVQGNTSIILKTPSAVTVSQEGSNSSCTAPGTFGIWGSTQEESAWAFNGAGEKGRGELNCSGSTTFEFSASFTTGAEISAGVFEVTFDDRYESLLLEASPWGTYFQEGAIPATFTNGTASTPSTITFDEALIGHDYPNTSEEVRIDGTFTATQLNGSLLSLE